PSTFNLVAAPTLSPGLTGPAIAFNGNANQNLLSGNDTLAIGDTQTITFTVHVVANGEYGPFTHTANGSGNAPNGTPTTGTGTTPPFSFPQVPGLSITKTAGAVVDNGDGSFNVPMTITVKNTGNAPLRNLQVSDNLIGAFPLPSTFNLLAAPTLS